MRPFINFICGESGATMVEYALLIALIVLAAIGAVRALGMTVNGVFVDVNDGMTGGGNAPPANGN